MSGVLLPLRIALSFLLVRLVAVVGMGLRRCVLAPRPPSRMTAPFQLQWTSRSGTHSFAAPSGMNIR